MITVLAASCLVEWVYPDGRGALLYADFAVTVFVLWQKYIGDELVGILYLLMNYYIYVFPLNMLLGLHDIETVTIVQTLSLRGLVYPDDNYTYALAAIVFKNSLMLALLAVRRADREDSHFVVRKDVTTVATGMISIAFVGLELLLPHAAFSIGRHFLLVYFAAKMLCGRRPVLRGRAIAVYALIFVLVAVSFSLTRSRGSLMILLLVVAAEYARQRGLYSFRSAILLMTAFIVLSIYGVVRDIKSVDWPGGLALIGIEALGEGGTVHLIGAHIAGLSSRNELPQEFVEGAMTKVRGTIQLRSGREMLADRYVGVFYPEIQKAGGGFAYPLVAELYALGGQVGVMVGGFGAGLLALCCLRVADPLTRSVIFLTVMGSIMRQEVVLTVITAIVVGVSALVVSCWAEVLTIACAFRPQRRVTAG